MAEKLTLELCYNGDGSFRTSSPFDFKLAQSRLGEGELIRVSVSRGRSSKQNRLFHALIQAAFDNQVHGPMLETVDHMRAYLLIRAGHCNETRIPTAKQSAKDVVSTARHMSAFLRQHYEYYETANAVMQRVIDEICGNICPGTTPDSLLDMAKLEAA